MAGRTDTEVERALARDRDHLKRWRSTVDGEAEYQETVGRLKQLGERLRAED